MSTVLFTVRATITAEREADFNRWYNDEHVPQFLSYPGTVSASRYRSILGEDKYQYIAVYEVQDEATLHRMLASEHFAALKADYDAKFGDVSERVRAAYVQVWP
jgi:antibiotic biosynthesis monooxygenase (ABM) superfamily enzyme